MEDLILNVLLGETEQAGATGGMLGPLGPVDVLDLIEHFILRRVTLLMKLTGRCPALWLWWMARLFSQKQNRPKVRRLFTH